MRIKIFLLLIIFFIMLNIYSKERNKIIENNVNKEFILEKRLFFK